MPVRDRKTLSLLRILEEAGEPMGSSRLAEELAAAGTDLTERAIRYHLHRMDELGLTESLGRAGRRLTEQGRQALSEARVSDRVGLVIAQLEELAYRTSFDPRTQQGTVVLNLSLLREGALIAALQVMRPVFLSRLCVSDLVALYRSGERVGDLTVPPGMVALGTVCSVTVNGILLNYGIPMHSGFGGLLELQGRQPVRFTDIIHYGGTSLDPLEIFVKSQMTSVTQAARGERGRVGAGFRLIPSAALARFREVTEDMARVGLGGIAAVGRPGQSLLDIEVPLARAGVVLYAGLNPAAAVEEAGFATVNKAMSALVDFSSLVSFRHLKA